MHPAIKKKPWLLPKKSSSALNVLFEGKTKQYVELLKQDKDDQKEQKQENDKPVEKMISLQKIHLMPQVANPKPVDKKV